MKELIVLVGNQGAGKTTYAKNFSKATRISQDDQGKKGHWKAFERALKDGHETIIIDRINHLREQRFKYLNEAKNWGYKTAILDFTTTPKNGFDGIVNRTGHPTLSQDKDVALKVLYMYYSQYEKPLKQEADVVLYGGDFDPYMKDLTDELYDDSYAIVGDIHGCYDELVATIDENLKVKALIATGDLVDRGPKIKETLEYFMNAPNMYSVLGNHEYKLLRYLIGNKVSISPDLKKSIDQIKDMDKYEVALFLMALPKIIKIGDSYVVHAGVDMNYSMERQSQHSLLYSRDWTKFVPKDNETNVFFGHHYHEKVNIAPNVYALDGHCVYGGELRTMIMPQKQLFIQKPFQTYMTKKQEAMSILTEFENEVALGNIRKHTKDDLVIYVYTEKCNYEKNWNEITKQARGIIFNRITGECLARPFHKFFNVGEMEETKVENLPSSTYEVYDKVDGSLGIMYWHDGILKMATKGSFDSPQAVEAMKIMKEKGYDIKLQMFNKDITLLFEIIYPENRSTPGAMLVTDYGQTRDLVLLAAIDRKKNIELTRLEVEQIAKEIGFPIVTKYNYTITEMIEMQKTLPKEREGFVVRFANRLRVKIKGDEYMKIHRLLNNLTPLFLWENMVNGVVPLTLKQEVPEEYRKYSEDMISKIENSYKNAMDTLKIEMDNMHKSGIWGDYKDKEFAKKVGLYIKEKTPQYANMFFPMLQGKPDVIDKLIMKEIRPTNNII